MYQFLVDHSTIIALASAYIAIAAVSTMPDKGTTWTAGTVYGWLYDFTHTIANVAVKKYPALADAEKKENV